MITNLIKKSGFPLLLAVIVFTLYHKVIYYPFLSWDDIEYIIENPCLKSFEYSNFKRIFTPGGIPGEMLYIPMTYLSFFLEKGVLGLTSETVHTNNLILHTINTILVYFLLSHFIKKSSM